MTNIRYVSSSHMHHICSQIHHKKFAIWFSENERGGCRRPFGIFHDLVQPPFLKCSILYYIGLPTPLNDKWTNWFGFYNRNNIHTLVYVYILCTPIQSLLPSRSSRFHELSHTHFNMVGNGAPWTLQRWCNSIVW